METMLNEILGIVSYGFNPTIEDEVNSVLRQLNEPLRLAIVGETSAGKSTLLNALVKQYIVPTGPQTLTYNVNVLRHISFSPTGEECIVIHFKDGEEKMMEAGLLSSFVDGTLEDNTGFRDEVDWVEVFKPYDYLKQIDIIDTPGLYSTKKHDSQNTYNLFADQNRKPDIILFVAQKEYQAEDLEAVARFQSANSSQRGGNRSSLKGSKFSGLNTLTAFTHCDNYAHGEWSVDYRVKAYDIIDHNRTAYPKFRACFFKAFPIAALYAQSAYRMTEDDFANLKKIALSPIAEKFAQRYTKKRYMNEETDKEVWSKIFTTMVEKNALLAKMELEVMQYAVWLLQRNPEFTFAKLQCRLVEYSGISPLESYIFSGHFGKLGLFYKAIRLLPSLHNCIEREAGNALDKKVVDKLQQVLWLCSDMEKNLYDTFAYLTLLRDFYDQRDYFSEEEWTMANKALDLIMSNTYDEPLRKQLVEYWTRQCEFFTMIYDIPALEAGKIILDALKCHPQPEITDIHN